MEYVCLGMTLPIVHNLLPGRSSGARLLGDDLPGVLNFILEQAFGKGTSLLLHSVQGQSVRTSFHSADAASSS